MTTKERLLNHLNTMGPNVVKFRKGDNLGPYLSDIYVAQETKKWAEGKLKEAWSVAEKEGFVPDEISLRDYGKGEHILCESNSFRCVVKVDAPRSFFDQEAFIAQVAKKFKLDPAKLETIAENCKAKGKPPLTKRVLEAA